MKSILTSFVLALSLNAFAAPQKAIVITNDIDKNTVTISINENADGEFLGIKKVETKPDGSVVEAADFTTKQLFKGPAVQIKSKKEIVKIWFENNFDSKYGGGFKLDYLFSAISGERRSMDFDLRKNGDKWEVTSGNKVASKLFFVGNKKALIGAVGVASIQIR